ncbi:MAG: hypothetical protein AUH42_01690 [Gemmatimonadetes bacterium 13_1_40CM_70_11]|nr:MAG: hypothetical protein AUH42_01690 [Gemmatimonadetes bacterium 13_1_40CM_70_11]
MSDTRRIATYTPNAATSAMTSRPRLIQATRRGLRCHTQSAPSTASATASAAAGRPTTRLPESATRPV